MVVPNQGDAMLLQAYPFLAPLYSRWENSFHMMPVIDWARQVWPTVPVTIVAAYVTMTLVLPSIMKYRKAFDLTTALTTWNLIVTIFSLVGTARIVPAYLFTISTTPFRQTICGDPCHLYARGATGLWLTMFTFSKVLQLLDTVFLILRKGVSES